MADVLESKKVFRPSVAWQAKNLCRTYRKRRLGALGSQAFQFLGGLRRLLTADRFADISKVSLFFDYLRLCWLAMGSGSRKQRPLQLAKGKFPSCEVACARMVFIDIFVSRIYDFHTENRSPRIFDCGANIGMATYFFKMRYPASRIEAFEADPVMADHYEAMVRANGLSQVRLHRCALAGADEERVFFRNRENIASSLMAADREGVEPIRVPSRRLSPFIGEEGVDLLKLDIEGAEWEVVRDLSATGSLEKVTAAVVEVHHHQLGGEESLAEMLALWEKAGFTYVLSTARPGGDSSSFQPILLWLQRKTA